MSNPDLRSELAELPAHPLATPGTVRLLLSVGASKALTDSGHEAFQIVGKCSYPGIPGRWAIYLQPVPLRLAQDACNVLLGKATVQRVKPATSQRRAKAAPPPPRTP